MKIHEYQAKNIFANFGMPVQSGYVFENIEEAFTLDTEAGDTFINFMGDSIAFTVAE